MTIQAVFNIGTKCLYALDALCQTIQVVDPEKRSKEEIANAVFQGLFAGLQITDTALRLTNAPLKLKQGSAVLTATGDVARSVTEIVRKVNSGKSISNREFALMALNMTGRVLFRMGDGIAICKEDLSELEKHRCENIENIIEPLGMGLGFIGTGVQLSIHMPQVLSSFKNFCKKAKEKEKKRKDQIRLRVTRVGHSPIPSTSLLAPVENSALSSLFSSAREMRANSLPESTEAENVVDESVITTEHSFTISTLSSTPINSALSNSLFSSAREIGARFLPESAEDDDSKSIEAENVDEITFEKELQEFSEIRSKLGDEGLLKQPQMPALLERLAKVEKWKWNCCLTGRPIWHMVVPNIANETRETAQFQYEKLALEQWLKDHPGQLPWPEKLVVVGKKVYKSNFQVQISIEEELKKIIHLYFGKKMSQGAEESSKTQEKNEGKEERKVNKF